MELPETGARAFTSSESAPSASDHLPSLLIIDDDPVQRIAIAGVGTKAGYRVVAVATMEDAISAMQQQRLDCITLDLLLDGQNGTRLLSEVAKFNSDALLIVVSGASPEMRESTLRIAADLCLNAAELPKPADFAALRILLTNNLDSAWVL